MSRALDSTSERLLEVNMLLMRSFAAEMRRDHQGLTPMHIGLLKKIEAGNNNLSELAAHLSVRLPTISKSIKLLVEREWVERWVPEDNRRLTMVRLTKKGQQALTAMKRQAVEHVAGLLDSLTEAERKRVDAALALLGKALTGSAESPRDEEAAA
jgi:DNA-binding MarR family transcriptional regulator